MNYTLKAESYEVFRAILQKYTDDITRFEQLRAQLRGIPNRTLSTTNLNLVATLIFWCELSIAQNQWVLNGLRPICNIVDGSPGSPRRVFSEKEWFEFNTFCQKVDWIEKATQAIKRYLSRDLSGNLIIDPTSSASIFVTNRKTMILCLVEKYNQINIRSELLDVSLNVSKLLLDEKKSIQYLNSQNEPITEIEQVEIEFKLTDFALSGFAQTSTPVRSSPLSSMRSPVCSSSNRSPGRVATSVSRTPSPETQKKIDEAVFGEPVLLKPHSPKRG